MDLRINARDTEEPAFLTSGSDESRGELTKDFLDGKLSFSEYAAQMTSQDSDDEVKNEGEASTSTATDDVRESKVKSQKKRSARVLPPALKGLVGEANLRYARGDILTAEKMCFEVIRQMPTAPEPFLTLAQIHENDNPEKSFQFDLIAAHLNPGNEEQWIKLGVLSEQRGNAKQADACYAKAIHINPTNIKSHLRRIQFLEKGSDKKLITRAKMRALGYMTANDYEIMITTAKDLAKIYHADGDIAKASDALDNVFKKCPQHITSEITNIMLELLLSLQNFKYCLEIFVQHCNIDVEIEYETFATPTGALDERTRIVSYNLPDGLPIDLHIKFIICLIHLKSFELLTPLLEPLLIEEDGVEKNGDLYLDVAEALMAEKQYEYALKLLIPLVKSNNFGMAAVWLRHAECLSYCSLDEQAIDSYKKVMELAPQHLQIRYPLSELLLKLNRKQEALAILEQNEHTEELDPGLLLKRCKLLKELKFINKYWAAGLLLLSRHCLHIRNRDEVEKLTSMQKFDRRCALIKVLRTAKGEEMEDAVAQFDTKNEPSVEEEFALFKDLVETCMKRRRYDMMQRFTFTALSSKRFKDYQRDIDIMAIFSCIYNEDCYNGYNLVRELVQHNLNSRICWNVYNMVVQRSDDSRHNRFLMRLLTRANVDPYIHLLHANNCLVAGTYKYALSEYITLYRMQEEPLFAFLIGVTLFQMASQKFSAKKDYLVVQGQGFLNIYKQLRGADGAHEADYNIGRGYHQLGILESAIYYYKQVLNAKNSLIDRYPNLFDLKREAAYNLHLIYKSSGNHDLAKMYLYNYIIV